MTDHLNEELVMTQEGLDNLKKRLEYLKTVKRYEVAARIKTAREYGDLSENAEYDEAKSEQGFVEGEISELEAKIKKVKVIDDNDTPRTSASAASSRYKISSLAIPKNIKLSDQQNPILHRINYPTNHQSAEG